MRETRKLPLGSVEQLQQAFGIKASEPLLLMWDSAWKYALAFESKFGEKLESDPVLGEAYLELIKSLRELNKGNGAISMDLNRSDTKSAEVCEQMFWRCLDVAGISKETVR